VRGEVEASLLECIAILVENDGLPIELLKAAGVAIPKQTGGWQSEGRFRESTDLAQLPSPYQTGDLTPGEFDDTVLIEVSRGCLFQCGFCLSCNYRTRRPRFFPLDSIVKDIRYAIEQRAQSIGLLCSGLNYDVDVLEKVAGTFVEMSGSSRPFVESTIHASLLDSRRLAAIRKIPWQRMIVGLQSTNAKALEAMGRQVDCEAFRQAMMQVAELHTPVVEVILGLPGDSLQGFVDTMRFCLDLPVSIEVYPLRLDPGSAFFSNRRALGIEADFSKQGQVISTPTFSADEMKRAKWALRQLGRNRWTHCARRLGFDFECLHDETNCARGAKR